MDDWKKLLFKSETDWDLGVRMFENRIETRYLEHVRALLQRQTSGFAVLTLDSVVIETLQQFRLGTPKTPYKKNSDYFVSFLTETAFGKHFTPELATLFYTTIRCGLLHQSEAGGTSRIKRGHGLALVSYTTDKSGVVINTHSFHELLEQVFHEYAAELRTPGSKRQRQAFRRKMNYVCRMEEKDLE